MTTNTPDTTTPPAWIFRFTLEHESAKPVDRSTAEQLMQRIVAWAEAEDLQIGGGYRCPKPDELKQGPIFDVADDKFTRPDTHLG